MGYQYVTLANSSSSYFHVIFRQGDSNLTGLLPSRLVGLCMATVLCILLVAAITFAASPLADSSSVYRAATDCANMNMVTVTKFCRCRRAKVHMDPFFQTGSKLNFYKLGMVEPMSVMHLCVIGFWVVARGETTGYTNLLLLFNHTVYVQQ